MQSNVIIQIIIMMIAALLLLIVALFLSSVIRRVYKERKYRRLDHLKKLFDKKIRDSLESGAIMSTQGELRARPNSETWQAIEEVLLNMTSEEQHREQVILLLSALGYISFHEKQLKNRNIQVRALSADRLGRMRSEASVPKLVALLDEQVPEVVSVVVRSLSKIGGHTALTAIVERLPDILDQSIVTRKAMGMALQAFGADAIPLLIEQQAGRDNLWVLSCILDILSRLPADPRSVRLAIEHLSSTNGEVRSKALKVLGRAETGRMADNLPELILPLLRDPVWFVRLQGIRSIDALGNKAAMVPVGKLMFDENWRVRNEAVRAFTSLGERSLDIFLEVLTGADRYAKDSICEEIERTNFSAQLIKNLTARDQEIQKKSRQVLEIMHSLGFSIPLSEFLAGDGGETEKDLIRSLMKTGSPA